MDRIDELTPIVFFRLRNMTAIDELAGAENVCPNVEAALTRAQALHDRLPNPSCPRYQ